MARCESILEHGDRELRRIYLKGKTLADKTSQLGLVFQRADGRRPSAGTMTEQEHGQARLSGFREPHEDVDVVQIVVKLLQVEPVAVRLAAPAQVDREHRELVRHELFGDPCVIPAVRLDAVADSDHAASFPSGPPRSNKNIETSYPRDPFFARVDECCRHEAISLSALNYA